jgi:hypothetical protein
MQSLDDGMKRTQWFILKPCQHARVHEILEDFDQDGKMLKLVRCIRCGLLIREHVHTI